MKIQSITTLSNDNLHVQFDDGTGIQFISSGDFYQTPMASGEFDRVFLLQWASSRLALGDTLTALIDRNVAVDFSSPSPVTVDPEPVIPGSFDVMQSSGNRLTTVWKALFPRK